MHENDKQVRLSCFVTFILSRLEFIWQNIQKIRYEYYPYCN